MYEILMMADQFDLRMHMIYDLRFFCHIAIYSAAAMRWLGPAAWAQKKNRDRTFKFQSMGKKNKDNDKASWPGPQ